MSYMPQLDGLRAIAVIAVMIAHFAPVQWLRIVEPWGPLGVRLFFVLSGFLITTILLKDRIAVRSGRETFRQALRRFYVRRTLRIFPIFYATVIGTALIGIPAVRDTFWWHMTYLSNVFFAVHGDWYFRVSHFWSLAVEEQFYLVWPFLVLTMSERMLKPAILIAIAAGPISRLVVLLLGGTEVTATVLPVSCLDSLGLGALLAYLANSHYGDPERRRLVCRTLLWIGLLTSIPLLILWTVQDATILTVVLGDLMFACFFMWLVDRCATGSTDRFGQLLGSRPMRYVGQISYSIYITHNFMPIFFNRGFAALGLEWSDEVSTLWQTGLLFCASTMVASMTYYWFEQPIRGLRTRFEKSPASITARRRSSNAAA